MKNIKKKKILNPNFNDQNLYKPQHFKIQLGGKSLCAVCGHNTDTLLYIIIYCRIMLTNGMLIKLFYYF